MSYWATLGVSFVTDFIISGGGALGAAMTTAGALGLPSRAAVIVAIVTGLVAAARRVQALLQVPPRP